MNTPRPNLFEALFDFRPRDGHSPKENFLTESFAYLLRTDGAVCNRWLSVLLDRDINGGTWEITTRQTEADVDAGTSIYPDLLIDGESSDGDQFAFYCEHKWDSRCDAAQLKKYGKLAARKGQHARLVFASANYKDKCEAATCFPDGGCDCFLWEDVFLERAFKKVGLNSGMPSANVRRQG
jgi:hypothetical protein